MAHGGLLGGLRTTSGAPVTKGVDASTATAAITTTEATHVGGAPGRPTSVPTVGAGARTARRATASARPAANGIAGGRATKATYGSASTAMVATSRLVGLGSPSVFRRASHGRAIVAGVLGRGARGRPTRVT